MAFRGGTRLLMLASLASAAVASCAGARADETLTCRYRPADSVEAIGVHRTLAGSIDGHAAVVRTPSPNGPWSGEMRVRISLPTATVWRDGRSFPATSGPSAVTWEQGDGARRDTYAVDRVNGDLYHWRNGVIVEGGLCTADPV